MWLMKSAFLLRALALTPGIRSCRAATTSSVPPATTPDPGFLIGIDGTSASNDTGFLIGIDGTSASNDTGFLIGIDGNSTANGTSFIIGIGDITTATPTRYVLHYFVLFMCIVCSVSEHFVLIAICGIRFCCVLGSNRIGVRIQRTYRGKLNPFFRSFRSWATIEAWRPPDRLFPTNIDCKGWNEIPPMRGPCKPRWESLDGQDFTSQFQTSHCEVHIQGFVWIDLARVASHETPTPEAFMLVISILKRS